MNGSVPVEIPDLRKKEVRELYRNDTACVDPKVAGDMLLPTFSLGTPDIPDEIYETQKEKWKESLNKGNSYVNMVMSVGEGKHKQ